jgi:gluconate 2-dehydrogenase gamma chain
MGGDPLNDGASVDARSIAAAERSFIEAAVAVLIPADENGPDGVEAGVVTFIEGQLAGSFGAGAGLYRKGPFQDGMPEQGWQLPHTPAELARDGIAAVDAHCREQFGREFTLLAEAERIEVLQWMEAGHLPGSRGLVRAFFELVLQLAMEGYFADPGYGGNRGGVGWRLVGFPGPGHDYRGFMGLA